MNRRQKKKWNKNHVTLLDRYTNKRTTISKKTFITLMQIAGITQEEFEEWIARSIRESDASG